MGTLILVRHAKSDWNAKGLWTGWADPPLSEDGRTQASATAQQLQDTRIDRAFTSDLKRCTETLDILLDELGVFDIDVVVEPALKERNYGVFTGKNKWQVKEEVGEELFQRIRRSWNEPIPDGETLKDVHARAVPYLEETIVPRVAAGEVVLLVSSGNALRAIVKALEGLSDTDVADLEIGVGEAHLYTIDTNKNITAHEVRAKAREHV